MKIRQTQLLDEILELAKQAFLRWERLRILYNLALAVILYVTLRRMGVSLEYVNKRHDLWAEWVVCALAANVCYFGGPLADLYATWLGCRERMVTVGIFALGVVVSVPLVIETVHVTMSHP